MSNAYVDPWDMLNNFCFHVYAQKSLFIGDNVNDFFDLTHTISCEFRCHRAGFQLKMSECQTKAGTLIVIDIAQEYPTLQVRLSYLVCDNYVLSCPCDIAQEYPTLQVRLHT